MGSADGNCQNVQWLTYLSSVSLMPRRPPPTKSHRYSMNLREQPCRLKLYRGSYRLRAGCRDVRGKQLAEILSRGSRSPDCSYRNVWSAALSQAKNESDRMVCANVFGLRWSTELLALMECAARSSSLVIQPWKAFPVYRFRERRVRPLCHLIVRQQTWQKIVNSVVAAGL